MSGINPPKTMARLGPDEVHLHLLHTGEGQSQSLITGFLSLLPRDERDRYWTFELESRRREFLLSQLFARRLLAFYAGKETRNLRWGTEENGKPFLEDSSLQFNLSHTQGFIACSVSSKKVGVDVEKIETGFLTQKQSRLLTERFFSLPERGYLQSLPLELQNLAFLWIFTKKEAYAKALGCGLSFPLNCLTVPLAGQEQSRQGSWEWFTRIERDFCVSHVVENPSNSSYRHQIYNWDEPSLLGVLEDFGFPSSLILNAVA